jgi:predicted transcriptional regulator
LIVTEPSLYLRVLRLLQHTSDDRWTVEQIAAEIGTSVDAVMRELQVLRDVKGLVWSEAVPAANGINYYYPPR